MKINRLKTVICTSLALVMLTTPLLTGCNKSTTSDTPAKQDSAKEEALGYPIAKAGENINLKYWMPMQAANTPYMRNYIECEVYEEMEKITGVKVEYISPAVGQENEQFNLIMASGDFPDMIQTANRYQGGVQKGVDDGIFLDLTPYAQKYAPDYYKLLNSSNDVRRQNTYDGGKILSFNRVKPIPDVPFQRMSTRQDWLDEANMKDPRTLADWETYLKWVKDNKPGVAPYILAASGVEQIILGAWNILDDFYLKEGKKVDYGKIQPEFKEYLTLMNKWYQSGYISKDFTTFNPQKALNEYGAGKTATVVSSAGNAFGQGRDVGKFVSAPAPYPRLKAGDKLHWFNVEWTNTGMETVVTTQSKHKEAAIRWLNYGYTEAGARLYNYGVEGKSWVLKDGKPTYTDYPKTDPKFKGGAGAGALIRVHQAPKLTYLDLDCNYSLLAGGQDNINARLKWHDDPGIDNTYVLPPVRLNSDETAKRAPIMTEVNTYVNQMVLKFIIGAEPLSKWDEYVTQVKKFGLEEAIKLTQQAYDRYMKN